MPKSPNVDLSKIEEARMRLWIDILIETCKIRAALPPRPHYEAESMKTPYNIADGALAEFDKRFNDAAQS